MSERPIIFSGPMVRAILAGTKTQTRRPIRRPLAHPGWTTYRYFGPSANDPTGKSVAIECGPDYPDDKSDQVPCPYGAAGDRLYVRETFVGGLYGQRCVYRASEPDFPAPRWRPAIHMPRVLSRLTLEITRIRVEQLLDISEADAIAEGIDDGWLVREKVPPPRVLAFRHLWEDINGPGSWQANPWVWVLEFRRIDEGTTH